MQALRIDTDGTVAIVPLDGDDVRQMQGYVGGDFETVPLGELPYEMFCSADGKLTSPPAPLNRLATKLFRAAYEGATWPDGSAWDDWIAGPVVVVQSEVGPEGETQGLSVEQISDIQRRLAATEKQPA